MDVVHLEKGEQQPGVEHPSEVRKRWATPGGFKKPSDDSTGFRLFSAVREFLVPVTAAKRWLRGEASPEAKGGDVCLRFDRGVLQFEKSSDVCTRAPEHLPHACDIFYFFYLRAASSDTDSNYRTLSFFEHLLKRTFITSARLRRNSFKAPARILDIPDVCRH